MKITRWLLLWWLVLAIASSVVGGTISYFGAPLWVCAVVGALIGFFTPRPKWSRR